VEAMIRRQPLRRKNPLRKVRNSGRKRKAPTAAQLKKKLWTIFSQYIRQRDADSAGQVSCVSCGKRDHWKNMDAGHYIPKSLGLSIYFDETNVQNQCAGCNRFRHGNLTKYALYLTAKYGPNILEDLEAKRQKHIKISDLEYEEMIEKYRMKIKELEHKEAA
jgi:5-methylcytosine-specific restriction endonuclease McrA